MYFDHRILPPGSHDDGERIRSSITFGAQPLFAILLLDGRDTLNERISLTTGNTTVKHKIGRLLFFAGGTQNCHYLWLSSPLGAFRKLFTDFSCEKLLTFCLQSFDFSSIQTAYKSTSKQEMPQALQKYRKNQGSRRLAMSPTFVGILTKQW